MITFAIMLSVAATVALAIFVLPDKNRKKFSGIVGWAIDFLNFRTIYLEKILKYLYIALNCFCVIGGPLIMFSAIGERYLGGLYVTYGLLLLVAGPIVLRLTYEILMMGILLVKNVIEINNKLRGSAEEAPKAPEAPATAEAPAVETPEYVFCTRCGTRYIKDGECPNCGKQ